MDKWDGTFGTFLDLQTKHRKNRLIGKPILEKAELHGFDVCLITEGQLELIAGLIRNLNKAKIIHHGDLHLGNVLYRIEKKKGRVTPESLQLTVNDFGFATSWKHAKDGQQFEQNNVGGQVWNWYLPCKALTHSLFPFR